METTNNNTALGSAALNKVNTTASIVVGGEDLWLKGSAKFTLE